MELFAKPNVFSFPKRALQISGRQRTNDVRFDMDMKLPECLRCE